MQTKNRVLILSLACASMAIASVLAGDTQWIPLVFLAVLGVLIATFGFKNGVRVVCDQCSRSASSNERSLKQFRAHLETIGWHLCEHSDFCPSCGVQQKQPGEGDVNVGTPTFSH